MNKKFFLFKFEKYIQYIKKKTDRIRLFLFLPLKIQITILIVAILIFQNVNET